MPAALLVLADRQLRRELASALERRGLQVHQLGNGTEALAHLEQHPAAVMVIESGLPLMSGFDLARAVAPAHDTALIIVTDVQWPADRKATMVQQLGLLDLLSRPVDPQHLADLASRAVRLSATTAVAQPDPAAPPERGSRPLLQGTLTTIPFARLLGELLRRRATGALLLTGETRSQGRGPETKKIVYVKHGDPVYVRSNAISECLGMVLVQEGLISEAQCAESLQHMNRTGRQQGAILLEMGAISRRSLAVGLALQLRTKLLEVFAWTRGTFLFRQTSTVPADPIRLDWSTAEIIAHGVRRAYDSERLRAALEPHLDRVPSPSPDPRLRFQELTLDSEQQLLLDSVDGTRTMRELLSLTPIPAGRALEAAYIFLVTGIICDSG